MSRSPSSPRKFSEKIALLNKKEAEHNAEFEKIIKEVEVTRAQGSVCLPTRTASFSNCYSNYPDGQRRPVDVHQSSNNYQYCNNNNINNNNINNNLQHHHHQFSSQHQLGASSPMVSDLNFHSQTLPLNQINVHNQHQQQGYQQEQIIQQIPQKIINHNDNTCITSNDQCTTILPNIEISPIDDTCVGSNQQVDYVYQNQNNDFPTSSMMNTQMSTISSARSLPDIANLRVSGSSPIMPSYSDERLNNSHYNSSTYDNYLIPESVIQADLVCHTSTDINNFEQQSSSIHSNHSQEQCHINSIDNNNIQTNHQNQIPRQNFIQQDQPQLQPQQQQDLHLSISPNNSQGSWHNTDSNDYYIQRSQDTPHNGCPNGYWE